MYKFYLFSVSLSVSLLLKRGVIFNVVNLSKTIYPRKEIQVNPFIQSAKKTMPSVTGLFFKFQESRKGLVPPKMKILSVFTHPHVVPTP